MTVWLATTDDKYELPIAVADSSSELARMLGIPVGTIFKRMYRYKQGKAKRALYHKIEIDMED